MKHERRTSKRHSIPMEASLELPDGRVVVLRLRDVSIGGALLEKTDPTAPLPPLGTAVRFTIQDQSERGTVADSVQARVVRVRPDGIAIEFVRTADAKIGAA
jgi:hypothetical protein